VNVDARPIMGRADRETTLHHRGSLEERRPASRDDGARVSGMSRNDKAVCGTLRGYVFQDFNLLAGYAVRNRLTALELDGVSMKKARAQGMVAPRGSVSRTAPRVFRSALWWEHNASLSRGPWWASAACSSPTNHRSFGLRQWRAVMRMILSGVSRWVARV